MSQGLEHLQLYTYNLTQLCRCRWQTPHHTQHNSSLEPHVIWALAHLNWLFVRLRASSGWKCSTHTCGALHLSGCLGLYTPRALTNIYPVTEPALLPRVYLCLLPNCVILFHTHTYLYKLDTHQKASTHLTGSDVAEPGRPDTWV